MRLVGRSYLGSVEEGLQRNRKSGGIDGV
jgi:hypothetical protein